MTRITLRFYTLTFQALVILLIAAMSFVYGLILLSPKIDLHHYQPYSTAILDKHGRLLSLPLTGDDKYRVKLSFEQIPKEVIDLTLLYEDKDFYHHYGVDFIALFRAFSSTYITKKRRMGASTLTMQVARLRWKINTQSWSGKVNQIFKALQIEHQYSKQDILTAYFNLAPYGGNVEGIGAASFLYFQKSPHQLNPLEAIILSVIPQNPNKRNPAKQSSLSHIKQAISRLIERLESSQFASWLTDAQDLPLLLKRDTTYLNLAPHFTQYIRNNQANYTQPKASVTTSLVSNKQRQAMRVVKNYVNRKADVGLANASVIVLNSDTMNIEVMIGSADFFNHKIQGQVNGTLAKRSPGSTLKPFIYGLALDQGLIHPLTILSDSPDQYAGYTPENFDKQFLGPISATQALITSRNLPAVNLQNQLSENNLYDLLLKAQVTKLKAPEHYGLSLGLGGAEVTMLELVGLYASLNNEGLFQRPQPFTQTTKMSTKRLLSPEASFLVLDMLKQNPPPATHRQIGNTNNNYRVGWKTGTSWGFRDAWAIGLIENYVVAVWVGNFEGHGNPSFVGATAAGPLLFELIDGLLPDTQTYTNKQSRRPSKIKRVPICEPSGTLMHKNCPSETSGWFIPGISPIAHDPIYRNILVNTQTGLRACAPSNNTEEKVVAFWPSKFTSVFRLAGITVDEPPPFESSCTAIENADKGRAPSITSPVKNLVYHHQPGKPLPLTAQYDSGVKQLYWFANKQFIAATKAQSRAYWEPSPGKHVITVVDDNGRSHSQSLMVSSVIGQ